MAMKNLMVKSIALLLCLGLVTYSASAQTKKKKTTHTSRTVKKRTTARRTTNSKTKADINPSAKVDTAVVIAPAEPTIDSLPMTNVKKSLRPDDAVDRNLIKDRTPLPYTYIREDDAVYREKLWREIDTREKMNLSFRYAANEDNGNQRFISILFKSIQDGPDNGGVTAFADDRFTTPMTVSEVAKAVSGGSVVVDVYDSLGNKVGTKTVTAEVNLDSFYKFHIKEEVIFDKQTSRLYWRILGIAPVKNVITSQGVNLGEQELFWVYYPDLRPILAKYEVYNSKNYGARMSWEELFESRMFYGRIIKSTLDNPNDLYLSQMPGLKDNRILQLLQGEKIKNEIFNYEQNLWSY
jgi:gliding motility associated protien GldN